MPPSAAPTRLRKARTILRPIIRTPRIGLAGQPYSDRVGPEVPHKTRPVTAVPEDLHNKNNSRRVPQSLADAAAAAGPDQRCWNDLPAFAARVELARFGGARLVES